MFRRRDRHDPAAPLSDEIELDETEQLLVERERRRVVTPITRALILLVVAGLGAFVGAKVQKSEGTSTSATGLPTGLSLPTGGGTGSGALPNFAALAGGGGTGLPRGSGGGAGTGTTGGAATNIGTVKLVDGNNVYVQDFSGNVTKLVLGSDAKVTVSKPGSASDLQTGQTVTYQGAKGKDGAVAATSISGTGGLGGTNSTGTPASGG